jgi:hypothetical protein
MVPILNHDCFLNIFEFLESDQRTLFKCILVNRTWFEILIPCLWENPFSIVHRKGTVSSKKLLTTIISTFPFDKVTEERLNSRKYYKVTYNNYGQSFCNYLSFMKIFKSVEFHGFIDKCSRVTLWKYKPFKRRYNYEKSCWITEPHDGYDESSISSILTHHIYDIIFKNCTNIRQFALINIPNKTLQTNSFNNLSNLYYLEVGKILYLKKMVHICEKIKKIVINLAIHHPGRFDNYLLLVNFLKVQKGLKALHILNNSRIDQLDQIPKEFLAQIYSIEELGMNNFMFPYGQIITLSKLKRLEITLKAWPSRIVDTFRNVLCPLLEVLKFQDSLPPLDALAEFIENTKGHLQCFYMNHLNQNRYYDTQLLLKSITTSCPKIESLSTVINITEDLSLLKNLLISCNELKNFTLMSVDYMNQSLLQEQLRMINENWDVIHETCQRKRYTRPVGWLKFNNYHIK